MIVDNLFGLSLRNFDNDAFVILKGILSVRLRALIEDVKKIWPADEIIIEIDNALTGGHAAFDPNSDKPRILFRNQQALNESRLAHELIHAIQMKEGFLSSQKIYLDKRNNVIRQLSANILHIPLVRIMKEKGFSIKQYFTSTLQEIDSGILRREKEAIIRLPMLRVHLEAAVYIRLKYEAIDIPQKQKLHYFRLYKKKSPLAASIGQELTTIIAGCDPYTPKGNLNTQYECVKFLNSKDLRGRTPDYFANPYSDYIEVLEKEIQAFL